jgi:hypothetical protein
MSRVWVPSVLAGVVATALGAYGAAGDAPVPGAHAPAPRARTRAARAHVPAPRAHATAPATPGLLVGAAHPLASDLTDLVTAGIPVGTDVNLVVAPRGAGPERFVRVTSGSLVTGANPGGPVDWLALAAARTARPSRNKVVLTRRGACVTGTTGGDLVLRRCAAGAADQVFDVVLRGRLGVFVLTAGGRAVTVTGHGLRSAARRRPVEMYASDVRG